MVPAVARERAERATGRDRIGRRGPPAERSSRLGCPAGQRRGSVEPSSLKADEADVRQSFEAEATRLPPPRPRRPGSRPTIKQAAIGRVTDPRTGVVPGRPRDRNVRSRRRCSMCPAIHISSRSWLRSSSTHEPSDPPLRVVTIVADRGAGATFRRTAFEASEFPLSQRLAHRSVHRGLV